MSLISIECPPCRSVEWNWEPHFWLGDARSHLAHIEYSKIFRIGCGSCKVPCDMLDVWAEGTETEIRGLDPTVRVGSLIGFVESVTRRTDPCRISISDSCRGKRNSRCSVQDLCSGEVTESMFKVQVNQPYISSEYGMFSVLIYPMSRCRDYDDINTSCECTCKTAQWVFIPLFPVSVVDTRCLDSVLPIRNWFNERRRVYGQIIFTPSPDWDNLLQTWDCFLCSIMKLDWQSGCRP